ncbi:peptide hydrolase [Streptomyces glebosus]|uniref:Peptide hydrolase n=1 Tax=Streptomyces glebosus TaxID=249580 RepID=A0A640SN80_9ACTN|nr:peptide hydrolase [Streptomyces glebosus]GHG71220.1 peptide hydrolase [Streptomyces glebosus]
MAETSGGTDEERWKARIGVAHVTVPRWARDAPDRCVYRSNATGTWELYEWDRASDARRRLTDRPHGTALGFLDPAGAWVWWFADTDGDERGVWMRRPFGGDHDEPAVPALGPAHQAGLALGTNGLAVIGTTMTGGTNTTGGTTVTGDTTTTGGMTTSGGTTIHVCRPGTAPRTLYTHPSDAHVGAMSADDTLVAIGHSEHGDSRHKAVRVLSLDGTVVADLWDGEGRGLGGIWDGPGKGLGGMAFSPVPGDNRLLIEHERHSRPEPMILDIATGEQREIALDLPGDVSAAWYQDGSALLIWHTHHARDELYRLDLNTAEAGGLIRLDTPKGVIRGAGTRPDGTVEFAWSSAAHPPVVRSTSGGTVLAPPGPTAPPSVPVTDAWVDGPGGRIHALISRPPGADGPLPCVFEVHGGPIGYDDDAFDPVVAAWVDHGFAVVQVNYRGSTGYGSRWRDAIEGRPGLTELEDIEAVREWAVTSGLAAPKRLVLSGRSWGGYLTLLGLGTHPENWAVGISTMPVADYFAAYEDEMEALRAYDRSLFGGSPDEVPERYRASSPLTYADRVTAPVLVIAGENDPRCPIRQIDNYVNRLATLGKQHEVYRYDAGHGSLVADERIKQIGATLAFARAHLPG